MTARLREISDILLAMPRALMRKLSRHYAHVRLVGDRAEDSDQESSGGAPRPAQPKNIITEAFHYLRSPHEAGKKKEGAEHEGDGEHSGAEGAEGHLTAENLAAGPGAPRSFLEDAALKEEKMKAEKKNRRKKAQKYEGASQSEDEASGRELARRERGSGSEAAGKRGAHSDRSRSSKGKDGEKKEKKEKKEKRARSTGLGSRSRVAPEASGDSSSEAEGGARSERGRKRETEEKKAEAAKARSKSAPAQAPLSMENLQRLGSEAPGQLALRHVALQHLTRRRASSPARQEPALLEDASVHAGAALPGVPPAAPQAGDARPASRGSAAGSGSSSARRRFLPELETLLAPEPEAPVAVIATGHFAEGAVLPDGSFDSSASLPSLDQGSASPLSPDDNTKVEPISVSDGETSSTDTITREKRAAAGMLSPPVSIGGILRNGSSHSRSHSHGHAHAAAPAGSPPAERERRRSVVFDPEDLSKGPSKGLHRRERDPATVKDPLAEILGGANLWAPPPEMPLVPVVPKPAIKPHKTEKTDEAHGDKKEEDKESSGSEGEKERRKEKKRKRAAEMAKPAVNNLLASLTRKYLTWFLIIAAVMSANFALCFFFMDQGKTASMEIKYGGTRRAVVRELAFLSRELFINDDLIMPFKELKSRLESRMYELRSIHAGLKYGNETLGLPGQNNRYQKLDNLMYMPSCLLDNQAACNALSLERKDAYNYGVDNLVAVFLDKVTDILKEADCIERNCEVASTLSRATSKSYAFIQESFGFLDVGLGKCIDLTVEESVSRIDIVYVVEGVILAFNIVSLASLYLFMFRPMIKQLDDESTRRAQLLGMFPRVIIKDNAFLHKYFRGAMNGGASNEDKKSGKGSKHSDSSSEDEDKGKAN
eukprot:tig00021168_g19083.t1